MGKQAKLLMADSGMMTALLRRKPSDLALDPDKPGKLFETLVHHELSCQIDASDQIYKLYHYRDHEKREIDFLIEGEDHSRLGVAIKSGVTLKKQDFKHMKWFKENIAGNRPFVGLMLYAGEVAAPFGKDLWAVPYGYLWEP